MQGELVGDFLESDINIYFVTTFGNISKSLNSFWLRIIFPDTLKYKESDGKSLRSVASQCLEILKGGGRFMRDRIS